MYVALGLNDKKFQAGLKNASAQLSGFAKSAAKYSAAGAAVVGAGLVAMATSASKSAANMEDLQMRISTLTGSSSKAAEMIKEFRKEAAKSPLQASDYANAAQTMLAFGMNADEVMEKLKNLADISMGNADRFDGLALAFSQIVSKGRLMAQEMNQMTERGFNPLQQISLRTGESMMTLMKRMDDGAVSVSEVKQAMIDATSAGGRFYKAIEKGSATTSGKIAQLKDQIETLKIAFGTGFNEGLVTALEAGGGGLAKFEESLRNIGNMVGETIAAISGIFTDPTYFELFALNFELALAKMMQSPGLKQINMMLDRLTGNTGPFNAENGGTVSLLEQQIEAVYDRIAKQAEEDAVKKDKARRESESPTAPTAPVEPVAPIVTPEPAKAPDPIERMQIDDYTRRGLAMSANPGDTQNKILKVQEAIRDILKNAQIQDKQLVW